MPPVLLTILGFLACSALIIFSGARLSKYGDIIANITGIGKAWLGLVLMASITSLPELVTGISSITIIDTPDIAVGDIMGSSVFNLLILAILDYFIPGKPLSSVVTKGHVMAGFLGIFLLALSVTAIIFGSVFPSIGWISSSSVFMIVLYLIAIRIIFKNEHKDPPVSATGAPTLVHEIEKEIPLKVAVQRYVLFALMMVVAAVALPFFADQLAEQSGMNKSFVGTLLVASTTSLPELVVSIAAVRMGSVDIAVGNLLGSNIFNILILAIDDILYKKGPLLSHVNPDHALSGLTALLMTSVAGIGIVYSTPYKRFTLGADAIVLIFLYTILMIVLYNKG